MRRRTLLVGAGVGLTSVLGGCLDDADDDSNGSTGSLPTATSPDAVRTEDPRVDEPPHEIERPAGPADIDDRDEWNDDYLGATLETDPSIPFEPLALPRWTITDTRFGEVGFDAGAAYRATLVANEADYERHVDEAALANTAYEDDRTAGDVQAELDAVDFEESFLLVVESGFGSGSIAHRWARLEADGGELHLHGYYTDPWLQTDDYTHRTSVLLVERPPEAVSFVRVSLTVSASRRVHFNTTEGVVTVDE